MGSVKMKTPERAQNPPITFPRSVLGLSSYPAVMLGSLQSWIKIKTVFIKNIKSDRKVDCHSPTVVMVIKPHQKLSTKVQE